MLCLKIFLYLLIILVKKFKKCKENTKKFRHYLKILVNGKLEAFSDYKVFIAGDNKTSNLYFINLVSKIGLPSEHFNFDNKYYSRSSLNYLLGLAFLKNSNKFSPKTFLEIGGFGT